MPVGTRCANQILVFCSLFETTRPTQRVRSTDHVIERENAGRSIQDAMKWLLLSAVCCWSLCADAQMDPASPATVWKAVTYPVSGVVPDPSSDQQTGSEEGDIVGNASQSALYTQFDNAGTPSTTDGTLGCRFRVGADKSPPGFAGDALVGLDVNRDGKLDFFVGVDNSGSAAQVGIWAAGTGANISPSTTTLANTTSLSLAETSLNYSWQKVTSTSDPRTTNFDLDGHGEPDYFLSFTVPFSNLVAEASLLHLSLDENTPVYFVFATATQPNSLNQDIAGVNGGLNSSSLWSALGMASDPVSPNGSVVPEPQSLVLGLTALALFALWKSRGGG